MKIKLVSGWVEGGIIMVILKLLVKGNSNKYLDILVLKTLSTGFTSVPVGSLG
jgi:hypothetical protein